MSQLSADATVKNDISARGLLVDVEGIDGSGKSTLVARLAKHCAEQGLPCIVSREPTNGEWGRLLRESARGQRLALAEELELFMKDRAEHVVHVIEPALADGKIVRKDVYSGGASPRVIV